MADFPLSSSLTAPNILQCPRLGDMYGQLYGHGLVDERTLVMLQLVVEGLRGPASDLWPWIAMLPQT